jgi:two-component system, chemotaxis family, chemotaxis protein CheY
VLAIASMGNNRPYRWTGPVRWQNREKHLVDKKILIIDDSATVRQQVRSALAGAGFEVLEAADGVEGLEAISGRGDLSAVLCDVNMPRMGGLQMLEMAKAKGLLATLPVVMLTTEGQPALVQQAKAVGAKGWIVKPFKPEQLIATMRKLTAA